jgi:cytochrome c553
MSAMAGALTDPDSADVTAWFAHRTPQTERSPRQDDPTIRLIVAGDPGLPPCAACHDPGGHKLGAPAPRGQHPGYIERQLVAFAQGARWKHINQQMQTIAAQLTPEEMHAVAACYGMGDAVLATRKCARAFRSTTAIFCPFRSDGFIKTQQKSRDIRGCSTICIRRQRGVPGRDITDEHDDGYRVPAYGFRHSEVRGSDYSNTYPVSLPTGFVGGRSSLLTAVLAAGPLPPGPAAPF